jgi:AcrR family transcriptional regulator
MPKVTETHTNARRTSIIEAAAQCFAESGFRATQMRDVAKQAGLSTGALYRYFASKEELSQAVVDWLKEQDAAVRAGVLDGEGSALDRLERLPAQLVQLAEASEEQIRRNFRDYGEAATIPFLETAIRDVVVDTIDDLEALIREARDAGDIDPGLDPRMTASALGTLIVSVRFARLFGGTFDGEEFTKTLQAMIAGLRT